MPALTALLTRLAEGLTELENYETNDGRLRPPGRVDGWLTSSAAHQAAFVQKIFVINFITSYLPAFLTAFVYVPFGKVLVPYLDVFQLTAQKFTAEGTPLPTKSWEINPNRLTQQVIYFTVTAQIINFATEVIVPYAKRKAFKTVERVQSGLSERTEDQVRDAPEEAEFLARVRNEAELDEYDVAIDYREMVIQFGMDPLLPQRF